VGHYLKKEEDKGNKQEQKQARKQKGEMTI
jgi:hypothetical protein